MRVLTENEVRELARRMESGGRFAVPPDALLTPLARDYLRARGLEVVERVPAASGPARRGAPGSPSGSEDALVEAVASEVARTLARESAVGKGGAPDQVRTAASAAQALPELAVPPAAAGKAGGVSRAQRAVVWAIGADRPGILAAVAELLGQKQVNILEISQTILSDVFAMVVIVDLSKCACPFVELKTALEALGKQLDVNLSAQRDEIFQYMHRI